jgi:pimeloyl-ACP methyl ester carboxylesterase
MLTVQVPTCVIWGMKDIALPPGLIDGLGEFIPKLTLHRVKNGSHWLVHEQPLRVAGLIEAFLRDDKAARPVSERTKVVRAVRAPRTQRY